MSGAGIPIEQRLADLRDRLTLEVIAHEGDPEYDPGPTSAEIFDLERAIELLARLGVEYATVPVPVDGVPHYANPVTERDRDRAIDKTARLNRLATTPIPNTLTAADRARFVTVWRTSTPWQEVEA